MKCSSSSRCGVVILWLMLAASGPVRGEAPLSPAEQQRARELLRQLGDTSFPAREQASKQLFQMGLAAKQVLHEGLQDPDPEVRRRCRFLLPAVQEADRKARLEAFIADKTGKQKHDLPGWEQYRKLVGEDAAARDLFVAMHRTDAALFLADVEKDPERATAQFGGRLQMLQEKLYGWQPGMVREPIQPVDVAPLFLVACNAKARIPPDSAMWLFNFMYQPSLRSALGSGSPSSPFRRLVLAWMDQQTDDNTIQQMLNMANNLNLKEGLSLAVKVIQNRTARGAGLATAIATVGKLGNREHVKLLEPFLSDATVVGNFAINAQRGTTQVRDVALAMSVHLTGQSHKDYGFAFIQSNPWLKFHAHFMGFGSPEQREKAFAKWQTWAAAQKK